MPSSASTFCQQLSTPPLPYTTLFRSKTAKIHDKSGPERITFSEKFACPVSGFTIPEIEPRLFSFNNPFGACPKCGGLGVEQHIDAELDRKSTRLNSSHLGISYAVFCFHLLSTTQHSTPSLHDALPI